MATIVKGIRDQILTTISVAGPTTFYVMKIFSSTPINPDQLPKYVRIRRAGYDSSDAAVTAFLAASDDIAFAKFAVGSKVANHKGVVRGARLNVATAPSNTNTVTIGGHVFKFLTALTTAGLLTAIEGLPEAPEHFRRALAITDRVPTATGDHPPAIAFAHERAWRGEYDAAETLMALQRARAAQRGDE